MAIAAAAPTTAPVGSTGTIEPSSTPAEEHRVADGRRDRLQSTDRRARVHSAQRRTGTPPGSAARVSDPGTVSGRRPPGSADPAAATAAANSRGGCTSRRRMRAPVPARRAGQARRARACPSAPARPPAGFSQVDRLGRARAGQVAGPQRRPPPPDRQQRDVERRQRGHLRGTGRCRRPRRPAAAALDQVPHRRGLRAAGRARAPAVPGVRGGHAGDPQVAVDQLLAGRQLVDPRGRPCDRSQPPAPRGTTTRTSRGSSRSDGRCRWSPCRWESSTRSTSARSAAGRDGVDPAAAADTRSVSTGSVSTTRPASSSRTVECPRNRRPRECTSPVFTVRCGPTSRRGGWPAGRDSSARARRCRRRSSAPPPSGRPPTPSARARPAASTTWVVAVRFTLSEVLRSHCRFMLGVVGAGRRRDVHPLRRPRRRATPRTSARPWDARCCAATGTPTR